MPKYKWSETEEGQAFYRRRSEELKGVKASPLAYERLSQKFKGKKVPPEIVAKRAAAHKAKGRKCSDEAKEKMRQRKLGKPLSDEHRATLKRVRRAKIIDPSWIPERKELVKTLRGIEEYQRWKYAALLRDSFRCTVCGIKPKKPIVHHILFISEICRIFKINSLDSALTCPLMWNVDNGMTVCGPCHKLIHRHRGYNR